MKETTMVKTKVRSASKEKGKTLDTVSTASLAFMGSISAIIGIWAVLCFVSVMFNVGPLEFFQGWFNAVTGM